jgi:hypothetical protein
MLDFLTDQEPFIHGAWEKVSDGCWMPNLTIVGVISVVISATPIVRYLRNCQFQAFHVIRVLTSLA